MKLLHIDSSILGDNSVTRALSKRLSERVRTAHKSVEFTYRDLAAAPLPHLSGAHLGGTAAADELDIGADVLDEFLTADVIIIGAPMYNFGISSQLKAWIDRICAVGKTFVYTAEGPQGLAGGKKVFILSGRGSAFTDKGGPIEHDHQEPYLRTIFGFVGIDDMSFIRAEGVGLSPDARASAVRSAEEAIDVLDIQDLLRAWSKDDVRVAA